MKNSNRGLDIKIVNFKSHIGHEGMLGLNCDLIYNGVKICHVHDDAYGGEFDYNVLGYPSANRVKSNRKLLDDLFAKVNKLPSEPSEYIKEGMKTNLDIIIASLCDDIEKAKVKAKNAKKGIVIKEKTILF